MNKTSFIIAAVLLVCGKNVNVQCLVLLLANDTSRYIVNNVWTAQYII